MEDKASGGAIISLQMDVNNETEIEPTLKKILNEHKYLDALVCNAGNGISGSIEDTSAEEAKYQFETNFFGAVKCIRAALPLFRQQGRGKIMLTSSVAGIIPIPFQTFYSASKAATISFMHALSLEVKPFGIQCCTVLPGDTKTEFTSARKYTEKSQSSESAYTKILKRSVGKMEKDEQNGMPAGIVARAMAKQLMKRKMKLHIIPGLQYKLICMASRILPLRFKLWIVGLLYA